MISREFIYEFSNFDDISTRENDIFVRPHDFSCDEMGVSYKFGVQEYEGSDAPDGIIANRVGIDADAPAHDLNGKCVEDWQNTPGIYIIGGRTKHMKWLRVVFCGRVIG